MKEINTYIVEKLRINKDSKFRNPEDCWDARTFAVGDILYTNPNIVMGKNKGGKPGKPNFYKVISVEGKKVKTIEIDRKLVKGDEKRGWYVPDDRGENYGIVVSTIDKEGFIIYNDKVMYLWDGTPEECWG